MMLTSSALLNKYPKKSWKRVQVDQHLTGSACPSQISDEIRGCLDFLQTVYGIFGFSFKLYLSTRPEKFMGDPALWDKAEKVGSQSPLREEYTIPTKALHHDMDRY